MSEEHDLIARAFAPFARAPGAFGLTDDAARLGDWTVTVDQVIEGRHFLSDDPIGAIARKLVRRNVSDLIAKGARPAHALLALAWPKGRAVADLERFADALGQDLARYGADLLGGDTATTNGPFAASLTLVGRAGRFVPRNGLRAGDVALVSGVIGDAGLGLEAAQGGLPALSEAHRTALIAAYRTPDPPPAAFADVVARFGRASVDISDGLIADAARLTGPDAPAHLRLDLSAAPLSEPAAAWLAGTGDRASGLRRLASAGDDYQTLFTLAPEDAREAIAAATALGVRLTQIGFVAAGPAPKATDGGWSHDFGAGS